MGLGSDFCVSLTTPSVDFSRQRNQHVQHCNASTSREAELFSCLTCSSFISKRRQTQDGTPLFSNAHLEAKRSMSPGKRTDIELSHAVEGPINDQDRFFHVQKQWTPPLAEEQVAEPERLRSHSSDRRNDLEQDDRDEVAGEAQEDQPALPIVPPAQSQGVPKLPFKEEHVKRSDFHRQYDASIWENLPNSVRHRRRALSLLLSEPVSDVLLR
jgi:hypothetical protein